MDRRKETKDEKQISDLGIRIAGIEEKYKTLVRDKTEAAEQQAAFDPWTSHLRWRPKKDSVVRKGQK